MTTPTVAPATLLTAAEFTAQYANIHAELVKGIVKEYPVPWPKHGFVCARIGRLICNHVEAHDLGHVMSNDTWIQTGRNPDTIRGADICFFGYERLPKGEVPEGLLQAVPDLVVEVRAPTDRWTVIYAKVGEYLTVGVCVVVVLDPTSGAACVYRGEEVPQTFHNSNQLVIPDVLPGFSVVVNRLFA